ncbi:1-acyl-sn-glycerol-3-phosphate acyltransferase [Breznakiella homolactica]|uniref:1-acyl-sn-glycerol-3-phosphate acyltransferase n=2 Tax=Breznakiella homolactica TaxID=2798577 RepID=A0A7T7XS13_9SPIR|nr:1-acyl-sn-glycerol-3-phosphate acyltransferase [Breznakiella homolactica]
MIFLVPFGVVCFILSLLGLRKPMSLAMYRIAQGWAKSIIVLIGCKFTIVGQENIPKKTGICFVSNHVGYFDIVLSLASFGRPFGFIAKRELMFIPFLNIWVWLLGGYFIDRKNLRKALRTINAGIERIKNGGAMVIFPEGTRSKGRGLLPFRSGSLKLATQARAPIVPVAITGSYDVFEKTGRAQAVPVRVVFSKPIETADLTPEQRKIHLSDQVHEIIEKALAAPMEGPVKELS